MYYAKVNWWNSYDEEDTISHMFICAKDWNEVMAKISDEFPYINSIEIREVDSSECSIVFVPESCVEDIINENKC